MTSTSDLIQTLSHNAVCPKPFGAPVYWVWRLLGVLIVYGLLSQLFLGLRPDLHVQLTRPLFALEIALLSLLLISSSLAAVLSMYPDAYQKPALLKLPYALFGGLVVFMATQLPMPADSRMVIPGPEINGMECALCIASISLVPSALIFALLRKGASVHPLQAGSFAVLAASAIGCLTLRLAEKSDSLMHLIHWHYIPTLAFAILGAAIGKWLLKW